MVYNSVGYEPEAQGYWATFLLFQSVIKDNQVSVRAGVFLSSHHHIQMENTLQCAKPDNAVRQTYDSVEGHTRTTKRSAHKTHLSCEVKPV